MTKPATKFNIYEHVTQTIIAQLEAGTVPWRKPWTGSETGFQMPLRVTGETYRGINVLMLWMAAEQGGYASPTWMTYKQAKDLGGQVRKGAKSTTVIKRQKARAVIRKQDPMRGLTVCLTVIRLRGLQKHSTRKLTRRVIWERRAIEHSMRGLRG